jgi:hypothetical protein
MEGAASMEMLDFGEVVERCAQGKDVIVDFALRGQATNARFRFYSWRKRKEARGNKLPLTAGLIGVTFEGNGTSLRFSINGPVVGTISGKHILAIREEESGMEIATATVESPLPETIPESQEVLDVLGYGSSGRQK